MWQQSKAGEMPSPCFQHEQGQGMARGNILRDKGRMSKKQMKKERKKQQGGRRTRTGAGPLVLVEVVTCAAAARVRPTSADTLVLTAVPPVGTRIDGCGGSRHPSPSCLGVPGAVPWAQNHEARRKGAGVMARSSQYCSALWEGKYWEYPAAAGLAGPSAAFQLPSKRPAPL